MYQFNSVPSLSRIQTHVELIHFDAQQKLTQQCKATVIPTKIVKKKKKEKKRKKHILPRIGKL